MRQVWKITHIKRKNICKEWWEYVDVMALWYDGNFCLWDDDVYDNMGSWIAWCFILVMKACNNFGNDTRFFMCQQKYG